MAAPLIAGAGIAARGFTTWLAKKKAREAAARAAVTTALMKLEVVHRNFPNSFNMRVFFDSKNKELTDIEAGEIQITNVPKAPKGTSEIICDLIDCINKESSSSMAIVSSVIISLCPLLI